MTPEIELPFAIPDGDDPEMVQLIASWRHRGPSTDWGEIVGHGRQVRRCLELVEMLTRTEDELDRLRLRLGCGLVICGPAGTGKTLIARAIATAIGRPAIVPPTGELTAALVTRLYAQLGKMEPAIVILDEADALVGQAWARSGDPRPHQAFLAALDGINTPRFGPITVALTTLDPSHLDPAAARPGRLAPTLHLELPSAAERRELLSRAISGLPTAGEIDLRPVVERTAHWTGAELVGAIQEACARSLVEHVDALRQDLLLGVVAERYVVRDDVPPTDLLTEATAIHEASHAVFAEVVWPGSVTAIEVTPGRGGRTHVSDAVDVQQTVNDLRESVAFALAGTVGEELCLGTGGVGRDDGRDQHTATRAALRLVEMSLSYSPSAFEDVPPSDAGRGSEYMRAELYIAVAKQTDAARRRAMDILAPRAAAIRLLARNLLESEDAAISGDGVRASLRNQG